MNNLSFEVTSEVTYPWIVRIIGKDGTSFRFTAVLAVSYELALHAAYKKLGLNPEFFPDCEITEIGSTIVRKYEYVQPTSGYFKHLMGQ